jgi:hypothetical protein
MNEHDLPPLDPDVRALVDRASRVGSAPAEAKARVIARVEALVGPSGGGGGSGLARPVPSLAGALLLGGLVGAVGMYEAMRARESVQAPLVVYVDRPAATTPPPSSTTAVSTSVNAIDRPPAPMSPRSVAPAFASASPGPSAGTLSRLTAERALLDVARGALEREDGDAALAAVERHDREYPTGILVQEREAIAVRALVMLGRADEARARAGRFRARFPESALLPMIDSTVAGTAP